MRRTGTKFACCALIAGLYLEHPTVMPRAAPPPKSARLLLLAAICIVVAALYLARQVLVPLALAILLSFLLAPICTRLERRIHRIPAVLITVLATLSLVGAISYVVYDQFAALAHDLPQYRENIIDKVRIFRTQFEGEFSRAAQTAEEIVTQATSQPTTQASERAVALPVQVINAQPAAPSASASGDTLLSTSINSLLEGLITAGIVLVLVLFMLFQRDDLRNRLIRLIGHGSLTLTTQALDEAATRVSRYLIAQCIVNGTYGLAIALGLWIIGLSMTETGFPNFALWGLLCAVLRFIPYVGPWMGAAFPLGLSIIVFPGLGVFVAVIAMFVFVELLSNNLMEPWLYGSSTGVSPIAIIFAAIFWTWVWGPVGLVLATPLTVCLVVIGRYVPQLGFLDVLLGDEAVFEPHQAFYQRLIALDEEDAQALVDEYLQTHTLAQLYDVMLIPALGLAEEDRHRGILDQPRREFIRKSLRRIIDDLENHEQSVPPEGDATQPPTTANFIPIPAGCTINILCLPAEDEADELSARMLSQVLRTLGYCADTLGIKSLASEMVQEVETRQADVVIVSAMPPAATLHARYLCKRLHTRYPDLQMLVTLWNPRQDLQKARDRLACAGHIAMSSNIHDAIVRIQQLIQPLLLQRQRQSTPA